MAGERRLICIFGSGPIFLATTPVEGEIEAPFHVSAIGFAWRNNPRQVVVELDRFRPQPPFSSDVRAILIMLAIFLPLSNCMPFDMRKHEFLTPERSAKKRCLKILHPGVRLKLIAHVNHCFSYRR
jgi:hypothetical protein